MSFGFIFTNLILKNVIARPRPFFDQNSIYYDYWVQAGSLSEKGYSFPSGHATSFATFAMGLFLAFNKKWSWPFDSFFDGIHKNLFFPSITQVI